MTDEFDNLFRSLSKKRDRQAAMLLDTDRQLDQLVLVRSRLKDIPQPKPAKV